MNIRPLENKDLNAVKEMMEEHPLQFPRFIIDKYPHVGETSYTQKSIVK